MFPQATVRGVDLYPPPITWGPPNCILEVDNILEEWMWREPFDLIHLSNMVASFSPQEWDTVYEQCYEFERNLIPGGWIEQLEGDVVVRCDDDSFPEDSVLRTFGPNLLSATLKVGRPGDTLKTMHAAIEKAGFVDIHERIYKWPIGAWPRDPLMKEAGRINYHQWVTGLEG
ncbi:hypothetical protein N7490_007379 [Penicillium lividum]|nr:hypothetical protein N7490_007379 [Penicillium lividum]